MVNPSRFQTNRSVDRFSWAEAVASALISFRKKRFNSGSCNLNSRVVSILCALSACFVVTGCAGDNLPKTVPAEGVVLLDGAPVAEATLVFIAEQGTYNATGVSNKDGKFQLKAFDEKSGAVPGSYKVEITKSVMEKSAGPEVSMKFGLPEKYSKFNTSGLSQTIGESGTKDIKFDLKSK